MNLPATLCRTAGRVHPDPSWGDWMARLKYCVRGLITPGATRRWFEVLANPELTSLVEAHPRIHSKLQRPYLHRRLTLGGRLLHLQNHYAFVVARIARESRAAIYSEQGCLLTFLPAKDPNRYSLRLVYDDQFEKEGDLTLALHDANLKTAIFTLSFTITRWGPGTGDRELFIGGLQGRKGANVREEIVELTRSLHGLRPKALLVFAVQRLALGWGVSTLRAVADSEHIYRHIRKRREIQASYDSFWAECLGFRGPDGHFTLPAHPTTRPVEELPSNKRSLYRKRYAMLEVLGQEIGRAMTLEPSQAAGLAEPARDRRADAVWLAPEALLASRV